MQYRSMTPTSRKKYEISEVKQSYLEKTDKIDKMTSQRLIIQSCTKGPYPEQTQGPNKPIVQDGDYPIFQQRWKHHAEKSELGFLNLLT